MAVVRAIRNLGLVVAERKTEAIFFHNKGRKPPQAQVRVGAVRVLLEAQMNYLDLRLDGTWCFREHIMLNVGGPDGKDRRLHAGVLNSVALYGAPVWAEALAASRPLQAQMRRVQRVLAARVARCYSTVSCVAATVLASMSPLELMALSYKYMYNKKRGLICTGGGGEPLARAICGMKHQARQVLLQRWQRLLANARTAPPGVLSHGEIASP
ncbi:uncharacterized protein LOC105181041 [Harpegnathos saltator]|uniref:uncharacterized protein LOC105181041 n=1 Tax=Harpegnathos saltator TaxID=610380 RepID=UPI000DBED054|nr:uncharacterized protein LOC105181041 [Harpegnathos saltator]